MTNKHKNVLDPEIQEMLEKERQKQAKDQEEADDKLSKLPMIIGVLMGVSVLLGLLLSLLTLFKS
ncbi:hypothetical protein ACX3VT_00495 [Aerococcus sanguinicola]|uniref:hypothetical protein n=1 Tax=unclassified Aerococcus TaxID=2618060 RepID=UPI0008A278A5|nr:MULTISPECIES: hypothetical protein [unclassified Aerococcus]MDK6233998.1 hypothetical protein [Aerococcus sp. UMB10185]MDK6804840.1 hypothetical protein [Aerococcus sp. UMB7834]MDK6856532.1 hypothetical protein [Aerococcus sp. UMB7533]MDK8502046.1 hypothetical protein [Aerococcus sp. UMB1112A]OFN03423.1 hypothetical protein HMPREF2626_05990 [Aerococcus sp. HMSC062A02]